MFYPKLAAGRQQTLTTEAFGGYDHNLELADGEFYDMENLSADDYPLLAPRPRRGTAQAIEGVQGILREGCAVLGAEPGACISTALRWRRICRPCTISAGEKQLISMGAYLCIFPDGIYFNTEKYSDNGYMGQENVVDASSTNVEISLCLVDGTALTVSYTASRPAGKPDEWPVLAGYVRQAPYAQAVGGGDEPVGIRADGVSEAFCQWHRSRFQAV